MRHFRRGTVLLRLLLIHAFYRQNGSVRLFCDLVHSVFCFIGGPNRNVLHLPTREECPFQTAHQLSKAHDIYKYSGILTLLLRDTPNVY